MNDVLTSKVTSKSEQTARVKSSGKQVKETFGIRITTKLLAEVRKYDSNISRTIEQAPITILEYLYLQNEPKSSKSSNACSFLRESAGAGGSVWYERRLRKAEAAGSNPARSTKPSVEKEILSTKFLC